jgi:hypothetical protein
MLPAKTPEEIQQVLVALTGRHALTRAQRRLPLMMLIVVNGMGAVIFLGAAVAVREGGFALALLLCAAAVVVEVTYKVAKLFRVTDINRDFIDSRMPLRFFSWRIDASELRLIDIELGQKDDTLLLVTKTSGRRRLAMPRSTNSRLRSNSGRGA